MDAKVKRMWLKALRSGKYKQAEGWLRANADGGDSKAYCCLGVLCEVYRQQTGKGGWSDHVFTAEDGSFSSSQLPDAVMEWSGLDQRDPRLGRTLSAAGLNDKGYKFAFIANRIEKYL